MFEQWVAGALKHAGIAQAEAARRLTDKLGKSIDRAAVNKMIKGNRSVSAVEMMAISEITGVPIPVMQPQSDLTHVPLVSWVSAGKLADANSQIPVEDVPLLAFADLGRGDFFALRVQGDSMDRVSPDGSVIVVNRADRVLVNGAFYVFAQRGQATYKRWRPDPPRLTPFSTNPENEPIFVKEVDAVGRVKRTILDL